MIAQGLPIYVALEPVEMRLGSESSIDLRPRRARMMRSQPQQRAVGCEPRTRTAETTAAELGPGGRYRADEPTYPRVPAFAMSGIASSRTGPSTRVKSRRESWGSALDARASSS